MLHEYLYPQVLFELSRPKNLKGEDSSKETMDQSRSVILTRRLRSTPTEMISENNGKTKLVAYSYPHEHV